MAYMVDGSANDPEPRLQTTTPDTIRSVSVRLNGEDPGTLLDMRPSGKGTWQARRGDLAAAGLGVNGMPPWIDLDRLSGVTFEIDPAETRLTLHAAPTALAPARIGPRRPDLPQPDHGLGMVLNYDLQADLTPGEPEAGQLTLGLEGRIFTPLALLETSAIATRSVRSGADLMLRRLDTRITRDIPSYGIALAIGDVQTRGEGAARGLRLGGATLRRDFGLQPDRLAYGSLAIEGTATVPGRLDLLLGNRSVYGVDVDAGHYQLSDIPIGFGPATAQVSLQTEDGEILQRAFPVFGAAELLAPGLIDFDLTVGQPRLNFGLMDSRYAGDLVGQFNVVRGLTRHLTFGGGIEATRGYREAHLKVVTAPWARFMVTARFGQSRFDGRTGLFAESAVNVPISANATLDGQVFRATETYVSLSEAVDRRTAGSGTLAQAYGSESIGLSIWPDNGRHRFGLGYAASRYDGRRARRATIGYGYAVGIARANLSVSASHDFESHRTDLSVGFSFQARGLDHALRADSRGGTGYSAVRSPVAERRTWDWRGQSERGGASSVQIARETPMGRATVMAHRWGERTRIGLGWRGAVAAVGTNVAASTHIPDAFAMVKTGRGGIPVRLQNRDIGYTDRSGHMVVAPLNAYAHNRISIDPRSLPEGLWVNATGIDVVPKPGAGVLVDFGMAEADTARLFRLTGGDGRPLPLGTQVFAGGDEVFVGYDGELFVENARAGTPLQAPDCRAAVPSALGEAGIAVDVPCL